jgi:hypothetical protein
MKFIIEHYTKNIDDAIYNKHKFVIGNANGADILALNYLLNKGVDPKDITIYYYNRYCSKYSRSLEYYSIQL